MNNSISYVVTGFPSDFVSDDVALALTRLGGVREIHPPGSLGQTVRQFRLYYSESIIGRERELQAAAQAALREHYPEATLSIVA